MPSKLSVSISDVGELKPDTKRVRDREDLLDNDDVSQSLFADELENLFEDMMEKGTLDLEPNTYVPGLAEILYVQFEARRETRKWYFLNHYKKPEGKDVDKPTDFSYEDIERELFQYKEKLFGRAVVDENGQLMKWDSLEQTLRLRPDVQKIFVTEANIVEVFNLMGIEHELFVGKRLVPKNPSVRADIEKRLESIKRLKKLKVEMKNKMKTAIAWKGTQHNWHVSEPVTQTKATPTYAPSNPAAETNASLSTPRSAPRPAAKSVLHPRLYEAEPQQPQESPSFLQRIGSTIRSGFHWIFGSKKTESKKPAELAAKQRKRAA